MKAGTMRAFSSCDGLQCGGFNPTILKATLGVLEQLSHGLVSGIFICNLQSSEVNSQAHCPIW